MKNVLKTLRQARSLTQQQLAEALGVSRQTVISIESGKYDPSLPLAFKLAAFLEVTIEAIFQDETTPPNSIRGASQCSVIKFIKGD